MSLTSELQGIMAHSALTPTGNKAPGQAGANGDIQFPGDRPDQRDQRLQERPSVPTAEQAKVRPRP